jgi:hypothetical protein
MPLNAAIGQVLWPIVAIGQAYLGFFQVFSSSTRTKRSWVDAKAPIFNKGVTYQMKEKVWCKRGWDKNALNVTF